MRAATKLSFLTAALASVAVWACSSTSGPEFPDPTSFCSGLAKAECNTVASLCGLTSDACTAQEQSACEAAATSAESATRTYHPDSAPSCVNLAKTVFATNTIAPATLASLYDTCNRVFTGSVGSLQACASEFDCTGTLICDKGFCATSVTKSLGEPCGDPGEVCATGSYCTQPAGSTYQCVAKSTTTCSSAVPCAEALRCLGDTCVARALSGEPCTSNDDCAATAPYCDTYDGNICTAGQVFAPAELKTQCSYFGWNQPYGNVATSTVTGADAGAGNDAATD